MRPPSGHRHPRVTTQIPKALEIHCKCIRIAAAGLPANALLTGLLDAPVGDKVSSEPNPGRCIPQNGHPRPPTAVTLSSGYLEATPPSTRRSATPGRSRGLRTHGAVVRPHSCPTHPKHQALREGELLAKSRDEPQNNQRRKHKEQRPVSC